jgi:hypothetical protein
MRTAVAASPPIQTCVKLKKRIQQDADVVAVFVKILLLRMPDEQSAGPQGLNGGIGCLSE